MAHCFLLRSKAVFTGMEKERWDEDEAQKNDEIHYKRIMVRPSGT